MATITQSLKTAASAVKALEASNSTTPALIEITHTLHGQQSQLRKGNPNAGNGGLPRADCWLELCGSELQGIDSGRPVHDQQVR